MSSRVVWLLISLASILIGAGCSTALEKRTTAAGTNQVIQTIEIESPEEVEKRASAHAHFLAGLAFEQNQQLEKALAKCVARRRSGTKLATEFPPLWRKECDKAIAVLLKAAQVKEASGRCSRFRSSTCSKAKPMRRDASGPRSSASRVDGRLSGLSSSLSRCRLTNDARKVIEQGCAPSEA
jgi:hypothetical protein